jgi:hypothetical protein
MDQRLSQVLPLYTMPAIYLYVDRLSYRRSGRRRARPPAPPAQEQLPGIAAE